METIGTALILSDVHGLQLRALDGKYGWLVALSDVHIRCKYGLRIFFSDTWFLTPSKIDLFAYLEPEG